MSSYLLNMARRTLRKMAPLHSVALLPFANVAPLLPRQERPTEFAAVPHLRASTGLEPRAERRPSDGSESEQEGRVVAVSRERLLRPIETERTTSASAQAFGPAPPDNACEVASSVPTDLCVPTPSEPQGREREGGPLFFRDPKTNDDGLNREVFVPLVASARPTQAAPVFRSPSASVTVTAQPAKIVEASTEVHLSIGRIELSVVAQAPVAKEARPRMNRTMSLSEYEQRRRERER